MFLEIAAKAMLRTGEEGVRVDKSVRAPINVGQVSDWRREGREVRPGVVT